MPYLELLARWRGKPIETDTSAIIYTSQTKTLLIKVVKTNYNYLKSSIGQTIVKL